MIGSPAEGGCQWYLQSQTELTRSTLVRILKGSERLPDFFLNPQRFMDAVAATIKAELHRLIVDGIKYERISTGDPDFECIRPAKYTVDGRAGDRGGYFARAAA